MSTHNSFCRTCANMCPVIADVEDGRLLSITGDRQNQVFAGYTCAKGRAQPALYHHPDRLLHSVKRLPDGSHAAISVERAMDEIAERLTAIVAEHGPRSLAGYFGTYVIASAVTQPAFSAFLRGIGTPMEFSPNTIDKPGKSLARAMLGNWMAPQYGYDRPDVALLFGLNPFVSYYGTACGHPGKWLGERLDAGMQLIVVDPRKSDIAKRAHIHLQPRPGHDPAIIAAIIHTILDEDLIDADFVRDDVAGVAALREAVAPFAPERVAARADVPVSDLVAAARLFGSTTRGYAAAGVGPSMSSSSTLVEYLLLVLETLRGHWYRAGQTVQRTSTLLPSPTPKAQAAGPSPAYGFGEAMRIDGLTCTLAGMPTGVLADEILLPGAGQVRALISCGGAPVGAWPDQTKAIAAMQALDLLVQIDPWMTPTGRYADYVIAPTMAYEVVGATTVTDAVINQQTWYGPAVPHAQYTEAIASRPAGSDLIEEWEFFYGLAQRMGLQLELGAYLFGDVTPQRLDMRTKPSSSDLLALITTGARVPLDEVKRHPHGATLTEPAVVVQPKDEESTARLDVANGDMLSDLSEVARGLQQVEAAGGDLPFRLICRRMSNAYNSGKQDNSAARGRGYNPAYVNPSDLERLGLADGDDVLIVSRRSTIPAVVAADTSLREGLISMAHGFGGAPDLDDQHRVIGSSTSRLLSNEVFADRYVGMPLMSNVPVAIHPVQPSGD